jgi:methylmalonyl-CoA mutase cobalamin-binding subunit
VEALGYVEEGIRRFNDGPFCLQTHIVHQGHNPGQDFSHPSARVGGVDVLHPGAVEMVNHQPNLINKLFSHDGDVVV